MLTCREGALQLLNEGGTWGHKFKTWVINLLASEIKFLVKNNLLSFISIIIMKTISSSAFLFTEELGIFLKTSALQWASTDLLIFLSSSVRIPPLLSTFTHSASKCFFLKTPFSFNLKFLPSLFNFIPLIGTASYTTQTMDIKIRPSFVRILSDF